jgi:hypothetical protein
MNNKIPDFSKKSGISLFQCLQIKKERQKAEQERQRADREHQRAEKLAAKLRELGIDLEA